MTKSHGVPLLAAMTAKSSGAGPRDDLIAGAFAGAMARFLTAPFDVLKIRLQLQAPGTPKYTSIMQSFATMVREEGLVGLWKGNISATYLWISYAMVQFTIYGILKNALENFPSHFPINRPGLFDDRTIESSHSGKGGIYLESRDSSLQQHSSGKIWRTFMLFLAGAGAGIAATTATYPFDIMRTQFAIQGREKVFTTMHSFISSTLKTKGIQGFYVGLMPALIGITPYMGLNFAIYESVKTFTESPILKSAWKRLTTHRAFEVLPMNQNQDGSIAGSGGGTPLPLNSLLASIFRKGFCGAVAGGASKFIVYPLDTIKKRLQVQVLQPTLEGVHRLPKYKGLLHCITRTYAEEGIQGFYRGIVPTVTKSVIATAVTFAAFESAKDYLARRREMHDREVV